MSARPIAVLPHLCCRNAATAIPFYQQAFGAEVVGSFPLPDGRIMHAALVLNGSPVYLCDEFPEHGSLSPQTLGGSPVTIHLQVADCDAVFQRAVAAGCTVTMPLQDMFWGDRYGVVTDPYGHLWSIASTVREVTPQELQQAVDKMSV